LGEGKGTGAREVVGGVGGGGVGGGGWGGEGVGGGGGGWVGRGGEEGSGGGGGGGKVGEDDGRGEKGWDRKGGRRVHSCVGLSWFVRSHSRPVSRRGLSGGSWVSLFPLPVLGDRAADLGSEVEETLKKGGGKRSTENVAGVVLKIPPSKGEKKSGGVLQRRKK